MLHRFCLFCKNNCENSQKNTENSITLLIKHHIILKTR